MRRAGELAPSAEEILVDAVERLALSGRGFDRAIRVGRTIADLAGRPRVEREDVAEALMYRALAPSFSVAEAG